MKKIISLILVALLSIGAATACNKKVESQKSSVESSEKGLFTIIVMDTTQALLADVQVKVGKQAFTTSFDGRVVLKPEQLEGVKQISFSHDRFEPKKVDSGKWKAESGKGLLIVELTRKPLRPGKNDKEVLYCATEAGMPRSTVYKAAYASTSAEDGLAVEEDVFMTEIGYSSASGKMSTNNVSAGKLTAGEVNDFAKWSFWPRVLDETHAKFIQEWRIEPRQRYTVQVMNKDGFPVANYPVSLMYGNNTLFQTVTDNTGKAELWGNLITTQEKTMVRVPEKTIVIDEPCDVSEDVDVMFVFDATGSMGDELHYLQAEMKDVIARAKDATGGLNIRTGAVVYRDHGDEYITRLSRLTEDISVTQSFIDKQYASGGGDYPEAVPEALMAALNSAGWNEDARARIAFLILDAPCHQDSATLALLHEQILNAAALGVRIVPVVCSGIAESGEFLLRAMALVTNGTSFFLTDDSGIGNAHLKPTTDSLKVEHLNDMLVRTIVEFSYMPVCEPSEGSVQDSEVEELFIPNPFDQKDLEADPTIPHGEGIHYIVDITGKLLTVYEGDISSLNSQLSTFNLPIGVYFIKTFYNGQWFTKKIFVR
ncbi:MAG: T9SS type A sorting domain-containing protein [Paludibacteraceae bacterium]|nr:T9SS type A sorting domain-containing protein [Paludibacteraceae bacterium]